jgi:ferredoxin
VNSIVIYFSITGNTKKIAQAIHAGMKKASQPGGKSDIARLQDVEPQDLADYDLIGLGSPVMMQKELGNVTLFITESGLKSVDGKHGFAFCTHGALPSLYLARVVPLMEQRGLTIIGWNDWFGSVFFPDVPKPYFTDGHPDEIDLEEAEDFGREMVERSRRIYAGETQLIPIFPRGKKYDEIYHPPPLVPGDKEAYGMMKALYNAETVPFKVNKEKCKYPKCTFCIDNCPMDAIDFSVDPPIFNVSCEHCWLCEMACPQGAIEFDYGPFHEVHWKMVPPLQRSLEVFEAEGRFRRLVPLEDIGWDTPFWTFKKPRYKIA